MDYTKMRAARKKSGLSVKQVAKHFMVSPQTYYKWETGGAPITVLDIEELARLFGKTPRELGVGR